jgi:hypothetical protein
VHILANNLNTGCRSFEIQLPHPIKFALSPFANIEWKQNSRRVKVFPCQAENDSYFSVYTQCSSSCNSQENRAKVPFQVIVEKQLLNEIMQAETKEQTALPIFRVGEKMLPLNQIFYSNLIQPSKEMTLSLVKPSSPETTRKILMQTHCGAQPFQSPFVKIKKTCVWITSGENL